MQCKLRRATNLLARRFPSIQASESVRRMKLSTVYKMGDGVSAPRKVVAKKNRFGAIMTMAIVAP